MKFKVSIDQVMEACENDDNKGFCIACGHEHDGVEPDARNYKCEKCDAESVYGAEEILIMMG